MCGCERHSDKNAPCTCGCGHCRLGVVAKTRRYWQDGKGWTVVESITVDGRPRVLVDPEDREQVDALCKALVEKMYAVGDKRSAANGVHPATMAAALRSLLAPPRPEEPPVWSVVIVAGNTPFMRVGEAHMTPPYETCWFGEHPHTGEQARLTWGGLHALGTVELVGEGVQRQ
jgi:hypothetical protein